MSFEEVDAWPIFVVKDRGIPLRVTTLPVELYLHSVQMGHGLVQLVGSCVELNEKETGFSSQ